MELHGLMDVLCLSPLTPLSQEMGGPNRDEDGDKALVAGEEDIPGVVASPPHLRTASEPGTRY